MLSINQTKRPVACLTVLAAALVGLGGCRATPLRATVSSSVARTPELADTHGQTSAIVRETPAVHLASWPTRAEDDKPADPNQFNPSGANSDQTNAGASEAKPHAATRSRSDRVYEAVAPALVTDQAAGAASPLSAEACVEIALAGHPKIKAARLRVQAARNRVPQVKALPDPMLGNTFWPIQSNALQTAGGRMQNQIGISQQVPWPEKLRARAAIACQEVLIAQAEAESIEREIAEAVRLAYYEVWFAQRGTEILLENQELVGSLLLASEARYQAGGSQQDVLNVEIERERLQQQLLELASIRAAAEAELAAYLQQSQSFSLTTVDSLKLDDLPQQLDALVALAEQCNPELRGLGYQIQRNLQQLRLANLQRYSDFQLGTQYGFMTRDNALAPSADGSDNISFSVGMTLPVYGGKIRGGVNEAIASRAATTQMRQSEQLTIAGKLRRLLSEIDALDQQRSLYHQRIVPRAQQALDIALSEYVVGKTNFVQLADNYSELLRYRLQVVKLESTLASRLAQLQRTVGCGSMAL